MRKFIVAAGLASGLVAAHAANPPGDRPGDVTWRHLACLKSSSPASLETATPGAGSARLLRARLVFTAGNGEPTVEWLWNDDAAAAAQLNSHLLGYRMPCLQPGEPTQAVLQEFWVTPGTGRLEAGDVWPAPRPRAGSSRYDSPDDAFKPPRRVTETSKVLLYFRFPKGSEVPEVDIAHSAGAPAFVEAVRNYVLRYRRCSDGRTSNNWHQQSYAYRPNQDAPAFKPFELGDFLGMVRGASALRAHFDLNSMQCPFKVSYIVRQPALRNSASSVGEPNPNRTAFLEWLGSLPLDLPAPTESALFDESLTVNVPCLVLNLVPNG